MEIFKNDNETPIIDIQIIKKYIAKIQNTKKDDILSEELLNFTLKVMKDFDEKDTRKMDSNLLVQEYLYLTIFFHKYAEKMYENGISADFSTTISKNNYNPAEKKVHYAVSDMTVFKTSSIWNIFVVMHENRHAMQDTFFQMSMDDILKLEPLAILMLKEQFVLMNNPTLYKNNHNSFIVENDANLMSDEYIRNFIKKYCDNNQRYLDLLNMRCNNEKNNYTSLIYNSPTLVSFEYENVSNDILPLFYENDRLMKQTKVTPKLLKKYPLLEFIYDSNGNQKNYQQLMEDKNQLIKKYGEQEILINKSSLANYEDKKISSKLHIEFVYDTIIKSNPLLQIEHFLNNNKFNEIKMLLFECPKLLNVYEANIKNLFCKYLTINNYSKINSIVQGLNNKSLEIIVEKRYFNIIKTDIKRIFGFTIDNYISNESEELKSCSTLNLEEITIYSMIETKMQDGTLDEKIGRQYQSNIHKIFEQYRLESKLNQITKNYSNSNDISNPQNVVAAYPEMVDLEDTDLFRDPLFAEYFKNSGMDFASEEEQRDFINRYLESKSRNKIEDDELEFSEKIRGSARRG